MNLVMGIDSGGTKTLLALADRQGRLAWLRHGKTLDPLADERWDRTLAEMLQSQPRHLTPVSHAVLGLPRYGENARASAIQQQAVDALMPSSFTIENDVRIAFDGAMPGQGGVLILAGTGSMAWASRHQPGDEHIRVGGWGEDIGDEGSAYWIGNQAIITACRHFDGRQVAPALAKQVCDQLGVTSDMLIERYFSLGHTRRGRVASLARSVATLAENGDGPAKTILMHAAEHLTEHILTAWQRIQGQGPVAWSYAGGVFNSTLLRSYVTAKIGNNAHEPVLPPIGGALLCAAQHAGWRPDECWIAQLAHDLRQSA